ncbi:hypothetical protein PsorP6_012034 [Peronosclerospora sorghi]|uniref:Uncharacterized protein n=1 Tax=Peronosclerospora sorghi TaxID=230839 RepID=A0ACC0WKM0_9STRA|nr:hypothetical protein PsorP6_012034 [Peronosclerospora sorghi]
MRAGTELDRVVRALEHVGFLSLQFGTRCVGSRAVGRDDRRVCDDRNVPIDVAPQINLDPVPGLEHHRLIGQGRVVADNFIGRDRGRERHALVDLLALEDRGTSLRDNQVPKLAQLDHGLARLELREHALERRLRNLGRQSILGHDVRVAAVFHWSGWRL